MKKYIDLYRFYIESSSRLKAIEKCRKYILRYFSLLNMIAPNKYELDTINLMASISNKETGLTVVTFSENPFRNRFN